MVLELLLQKKNNLKPTFRVTRKFPVSRMPRLLYFGVSSFHAESKKGLRIGERFSLLNMKQSPNLKKISVVGSNNPFCIENITS